MKIPFLEFTNRITGISTPVFGVSWEPPTLDIEVAKNLLAFLEDRRVLYNSFELERPQYVVKSVIEIRKRLTHDLERLDRSSPLAEAITAMRASCRKLLDEIQKFEINERRLLFIESMIIASAIGELRGVFGIHIAQIAVRYGVDVEQELASILPTQSENSDEETTLSEFTQEANMTIPPKGKG
jgi:hypothetical protein